MVLLMAIAAIIFLVGIQNALLVGFAALVAYIHPIQSVLFIGLLIFLRWKGMVLKQSLTNYFKRKIGK